MKSLTVYLFTFVITSVALHTVVLFRITFPSILHLWPSLRERGHVSLSTVICNLDWNQIAF